MPARLTAPWLALAAVTLTGLVVRAIPVALADFPVNDGGLFMAMTRAITDEGWGLPATLAWNSADLPFAYPPLAFYAAGGLETLLGLDLLGVFRWIPLLASILVVPAVYLLARELLRSSLGGLVAALAYALAPASYVWLVQGGGVTRSPGLLLGVLTLWQVVLLVREPTRNRAPVVGVLAGLTALTHPGAAIFVGISAALIWLFEGRTRAGLASGLGAAAVALAVSAPWWGTLAARGQLGAVAGVPSNGPDTVAAIFAVLAGRVTGTPFTDPLAVIGLAVAVLCLFRRRFLLPIWFVLALALSYQYAMIPLGMLVAIPVVDLATLRAGPTGRRWALTVGLALVGLALVIEAAASAATVLNPAAPVHALSADRRAAMAWVEANLEPDARVAVITDSVWSGDPDSEWFPLLTGRQSVATVQGSEWLGESAFNEQVRAHRALQACVRPASVSCVQEWLAEWPAGYLYLPMGPLHGPNSPADCCADLRAALLADPAFPAVDISAGATVFGAPESQ